MKSKKLLYRTRLGLLAALGFGSLTGCVPKMYGPPPVMYGPGPDMYGPPTELLPEQPQPETADAPEADVEGQDVSK